MRVIEATAGEQALLSLVIHEGRNRQVRKMCDAIGHPVVRLRRVRIGPIADDRLPPGKFRELTRREVESLQKTPAPESPRSGRRRERAGASEPGERSGAPGPRERASRGVRGAKPLGD